MCSVGTKHPSLTLILYSNNHLGREHLRQIGILHSYGKSGILILDDAGVKSPFWPRHQLDKSTHQFPIGVTGGIAMIEATSCGGVVIFRGKILLLYKNYKNKYEGWVLPKGTVEDGEEYKETAVREVKEETGVLANIIKYVGKSQYTFNTPGDTVNKDVHWYLMMADSYYSKPQREEYFLDSGYYKFHEAYHLLKFANEKQILEKAYDEYVDLKKSNLWGNRKYF